MKRRAGEAASTASFSAGVVFAFSLPRGLKRCLHKVVQAADNAQDHSDDQSPRCGAVVPVDPVPDERKHGNGARQFKPDWSNWNAPELQGVRRLFGGDLRHCEPLGGPWYFCCFT